MADPGKTAQAAYDIASKIKIKRASTNLFDLTTATANSYVQYNNGTIAANASYTVSDYIPVSPSTQYIRTYRHQLAFYDSNKVYISGLNSSFPLENTQVFTTPANCKYVRVTIGNAYVSTFILKQGTSLQDDYYLFSADGKTIKLLPSKNLFDKSAVTQDYFLNYATGTLSPNTSYVASDYIPVKPNTIYASTYVHQSAFYDANKTYISGVLPAITGVAGTFTTPPTCYFIRVTVAKSAVDKYQFEEGSTQTTYAAYTDLSASATSTNAVQSDTFLLFLPSEICVAVGRTIELYHKQIAWCGNPDNYHFKWSGGIGQARKRKWTCTGTSANVGSYTLTCTVYDNNMNQVAQASTTVKIVNKSTVPSATQKILCIGDSLSNDKPWYAEWRSLASAMFGQEVITFVGTCGGTTDKHEGRSGYTSGNYTTNSSYSFQGNVRITVSGVTTIPTLKKQYYVPTSSGNRIFEVETVGITNGSGTIDLNRLSGDPNSTGGNVNATGTITAVDSGVAGDSSITYSSVVVTSVNPFWNPTTSAVDFSYYATQTGITPDAVQIWLGTNGIALDATTNVTNIKTLVDAIQRDWPGKPIYLVFTLYRASQDGIGIQNGATGVWKLEEDRKVYNLMVGLFDTFKSYTKVFFTPVALAHDSEYNFGSTSTAVNPRAAQTESLPIEATHPQSQGYLQIADIQFSTWLAHYLE